jgi:hypothetical protein
MDEAFSENTSIMQLYDRIIMPNHKDLATIERVRFLCSSPLNNICCSRRRASLIIVKVGSKRVVTSIEPCISRLEISRKANVSNLEGNIIYLIFYEFHLDSYDTDISLPRRRLLWVKHFHTISMQVQYCNGNHAICRDILALPTSSCHTSAHAWTLLQYRL